MSQEIKYKLLLVSLARPSREEGLASETKLLPLQFCSLLIQILFDTAIETTQLGQYPPIYRQMNKGRLTTQLQSDKDHSSLHFEVHNVLIFFISKERITSPLRTKFQVKCSLVRGSTVHST